MNEPNGDAAQLANAENFDPPEVTDWRMGEHASIDVERTGLATDDRIVEVAVVRVRQGKRVSAWRSLVNPGRPVGDSVSIHGLTDKDLEGAPAIGELRVAIAEQLEGADAIVAYNGLFADFPWLEQELPGILPKGPVYADPLVLVRRVFRYMKGSGNTTLKCPIWSFDNDGYVEQSPKRTGRHSLGAICDFLGVFKNEPDAASKLHTAEFDAWCAALVLWELRPECNPNGTAFEKWARAEAVRQNQSLQAYFDRLRAEDAAKRVARQTFEQRFASMLMDHTGHIGDRLDTMQKQLDTALAPLRHLPVEPSDLERPEAATDIPEWMVPDISDADRLESLAEEATFGDVGFSDEDSPKAGAFLRRVANELRDQRAAEIDRLERINALESYVAKLEAVAKGGSVG